MKSTVLRWGRRLYHALRARQNTRWAQAGWLLVGFGLPLLAFPLARRAPQGGYWEPVSALAAPASVHLVASGAAEGQTVLYVAVEDWGIFRSEDGGRNWAAANRLPRDEQGRLHIEAIAVSPQDPQVALAMVDNEAVAGWAPIYKTADGGRTWIARRGLLPLNLEAIAIGPAGTAYAAHGWRIYRSPNEGDTWLQAGRRPPAGRALAIAEDGVTGALYVGTEDQGLWATMDNGMSWYPSLPHRSVYAIAASDSGWVYAGTQDGLYCSTDHGASWRALGPLGMDGHPDALAVRSGSPDSLFVSLEGRAILHSPDGGANWQALPPVPVGVEVTALAADPLSPEQLYVGTTRGLWRCRLQPPSAGGG